MLRGRPGLLPLKAVLKAMRVDLTVTLQLQCGLYRSLKARAMSS